MASATISKSQLRRQLMTAVPGVAGTNLETPRDIFAVEEESTTHNATNGTHNAVNQQNGRSTTTAAARSRHPNGNANTPPPPTIITIDATLKTKIEALLIKKTHELDHDLINGAINQESGYWKRQLPAQSSNENWLVVLPTLSLSLHHPTPINCVLDKQFPTRNWLGKL
jgi:hypothetical protein